MLCGCVARPELERQVSDFEPRALLATLALVSIRFSQRYSDPKQRLQTRPRRDGALIVRMWPGHFLCLSFPIHTVKRLVGHIFWTK